MLKITNARRGARLAGAVGAFVLLAASLGACSTPQSGGTLVNQTLVVPTNESPWLPAYRALVAAYTEETGVKVDLRAFPYDELRTQLINDVQGGTQTYDVFQIGEANMFEFFTNEWMQPLHDIDPAFEPEAQTIDYSSFARWNPEKKTSDPDGELMVQPLQNTVQLLMYRKDIYDKLGLNVPKTWDDVLANGKAAMEAGEVDYGYILRGQPSTTGGTLVTYDFEPFLFSYGGSWFVEEGVDWTPAVNSPEAIEAAAMMRELAKLGPAETTTLGQAQVISTMQAGDALQSNLVNGAAASLESESDSNITGKVGYSVLPAGPSGEPGVTSNLFALGVPAGLDEGRAKAALNFIKWVNSRDAQVVFAEAGGVPTRLDAIEAANLSPADSSSLSAVRESAPYAKSGTRYAFTAEMLPVTEKWLAQIVAGSISPEEGMNNMQSELLGVVEDAGYPVAGG
jgi:multiple sugar transport system substrate-binding protein